MVVNKKWKKIVIFSEIQFKKMRRICILLKERHEFITSIFWEDGEVNKE